MSEDAVRVEGLNAVAKAIRRIDPELAKELRVVLNDAADTIVDRARPGVPKRSGRAAASIKAKSTRSLARVTGGGSRAPYYPWLDFGGRVGRRRSVTRQFRKRGRYIYNAYFRARDSGEFQDQMHDGLLDVLRRAGLETD